MGCARSAPEPALSMSSISPAPARRRQTELLTRFLAMSTNGDTTTKLPRPRSSVVFDGPDRAHSRAYMKGIGFDDDALSRPTVGIANTWTEAMPCNFHLRAEERRVGKECRSRWSPDHEKKRREVSVTSVNDVVARL